MYIWSRFILGKKIKWNRNPQKTSNLISGIWSLILNWNDSYLFYILYKSFGNFLLIEKKIKLWLHFVISGCWLGLLKTFYNNIIRASNYQTIMISYIYLNIGPVEQGVPEKSFLELIIKTDISFLGFVSFVSVLRPCGTGAMALILPW